MAQMPFNNGCTKYIVMEAPHCSFINYLKLIGNYKICLAISQHIYNINACIIDKMMLSSIHEKAKYISIPIDSRLY